MDPYQFEDLVRRLLEEMGYEDVETTSPSNDKGVDVVGDIEVGITAVREVVQVKRYRSNIQRPVVDALRGSLHRFGAVRGTIINTSGFSKGTREAAFERGAAPITLIDGEKLITLMIEHQLGVRKKAIGILELDETTLLSEDEEEEAQP
jgi:restriction system protein